MTGAVRRAVASSAWLVVATVGDMAVTAARMASGEVEGAFTIVHTGAIRAPGAWALNHSREATTHDRSRGRPANPSRTSTTRYCRLKPSTLDEKTSPSLAPRAAPASVVEMIAGIGPEPGVVKPSGNAGSAGVPASAAAIGTASARANSVCGPACPAGTVPSNTPAVSVTPGSAAASRSAGREPVGAWSR